MAPREPIASLWKNFIARDGGPQPFSRETVDKRPRTDGARAVRSVCPYCAVGCGQLIYARDGQIVRIEGDPESPINHGTLCPKGAATFQYVVNPLRQTRCLYRRPRGDRWEEVPLEWAMERVARRIKETRDAAFVERLPDDQVVNHCLAIASLGGATTFPQDLVNSDCILIIGSNMAEFGVTLVGMLRGERFVVYSHPERVEV